MMFYLEKAIASFVMLRLKIRRMSFLSVISGTFDIIGLKDEPVIRYNDLLKYYDTNNKYAEVASVEKHVDYIFERAYSFKKRVFLDNAYYHR